MAAAAVSRAVPCRSGAYGVSRGSLFSTLVLLDLWGYWLRLGSVRVPSFSSSLLSL